MEWLASLGADCDQWGMVLVAEMKPGGFDSGPEFQTLDNHMLAARLGSEYGADLIKMPHCDGFEAVVAGCYTPIVVLGGSKMSEEQLITMVYNAIAGRRGGLRRGPQHLGRGRPDEDDRRPGRGDPRRRERRRGDEAVGVSESANRRIG